jgi:CRP-like cAMP-binding protein
MELLKEYITNVIDISEDELNIFCGYFKPKKIKKNDYLLRLGEICDFEAFVTKGCFELTHINNQGKTFTLYFAYQWKWLTDLDSFLHNKPAEFYFKAIEDSEVLLISKTHREICCKQMHSIDTLFRIMGENSLISFKNMFIDSISKTAEERYWELMKNLPVANQLTNLQISNYLGVSREFVSKIRKKSIKK